MVHRLRRGGLDPIALVFEQRPAAPDPEHQPAAAHPVEHADFLVQPQRMVQRQHIDQRAHPQLLGALEGGGQEYAGAGGKAERRGVVLGQVIAGKSCPLDQFDQPQPAFEERVRCRAVVVQVVENSEFEHVWLPARGFHSIIGTAAVACL